MKKSLVMAMVCLITVVAFGQQIFSTNVTVNTIIPDGNANGLAEGITIGGLADAISSLTVSLDITGGFNGDLYAYLAGPDGGFAVLLNRTGVGSSSAYGYGDAGFNITLSDTAANGNIHDYQNVLDPAGGQLTGAWQPDGINIDPQSAGTVFDTTSPSAMLSSFSGLDGNGQWVFFIADLSSGGQSTLQSVQLNIMTVPEPQILALFLMGGVLLWVVGRRRIQPLHIYD